MNTTHTPGPWTITTDTGEVLAANLSGADAVEQWWAADEHADTYFGLRVIGNEIIVGYQLRAALAKVQS